MMADQGALSVDALIRDVVYTGTNVLRSNDRLTRSAVTSTDKLTTAEIRKAVRLLKRNKAPTFQRGGKGYYVCVIGPDAVYDLQADPLWVDVSKYQDAEQIYTGEIGRLFGIIFIETSECMNFGKVGSGGIDVFGTVIFGRDAYGVVSLEGKNAHTIIKPMGSAGSSDPLDQMATVGWKLDGFCAKILQQGWIVRVEHAVSS